MKKQLLIYFAKIISKLQCGCQKVPNNGLLLMLKKWKNVADNGETFGALLANLSKEFDCIITKLNVYGVFSVKGSA